MIFDSGKRNHKRIGCRGGRIETAAITGADQEVSSKDGGGHPWRKA